MPSTRNDAAIQRLYDRIAAEPLGNWLDERVFCLTEDSPYRRKTMETLALQPGDRVLDLACGMGQNFKLLQYHSLSHLVGVDISAVSLAAAARRVKRYGWTNVELIHTPLADYRPDQPFDAALCSFALCIIPDYRAAVDRLMAALKPGGRWAILDMQPSPRHPRLNRAWAWMNRRYSGGDVRRDIPAYVRSVYGECHYETCFGGFYYSLSGTTSMQKQPLPPYN